MFYMFVMILGVTAALNAEEMRASIPRAAWQKFRPEPSMRANPEVPAAEQKLGPATPTGANPAGPAPRRTRASNPNPSTARDKLRSVAMAGDANRKVHMI